MFGFGKLFSSLFFLAAIALIPNAVWAGASTTQNLSMTVNAINLISVSGNPSPLVVGDATVPGEPPADATDSSTTMSYTTSVSPSSIKAILNSNMPANTSLKVQIAVEIGKGTSMGQIILTSAASKIIGSIPACYSKDRMITYVFHANLGAPPMTFTRIVTWVLAQD